MDCVCGRMSQFLFDSEGTQIGFVLEGGTEVRFWVSPANCASVQDVAAVGSLLEVEGDLRSGEHGKKYLQAALITNKDSRRTAGLPAPMFTAHARMLRR